MKLSVELEIADAAKTLVNDAIANIGDQLSNDRDRQEYLARMHAIGDQGIQSIIDGEDCQKHLERGAYETSVWIANHYADSMLNRVAIQFPPGKTRNKIFDAMQQLSRTGIEGLCRGETSAQIRSRLSSVATNLATPYAQKFSQNLSHDLYRSFKTSGRGSRSTNQHIRGLTNQFGSELGNQLVVNLGEVLNGRKNLGDAVTDVAINSATNSVANYGKDQGEKIAAQALKTLSKEAEKKLGQTLAVDTLKKFANSNAIITTAGAIYDIGKSFDQMLDCEISASEFLTTVGQKGVEIVVQNAATVLGTIVGGSVGFVVGSVINYFASSFLGGIVNKLRAARAEAVASRKRYEFIHAFCEYQIQKLEQDRLEFERRAAEFFSNRQHVIDVSLAEYESAMRDGDFEKNLSSTR